MHVVKVAFYTRDLNAESHKLEFIPAGTVLRSLEIHKDSTDKEVIMVQMYNDSPNSRIMVSPRVHKFSHAKEFIKKHIDTDVNMVQDYSNKVFRAKISFPCIGLYGDIPTKKIYKGTLLDNVSRITYHGKPAILFQWHKGSLSYVIRSEDLLTGNIEEELRIIFEECDIPNEGFAEIPEEIEELELV